MEQVAADARPPVAQSQAQVAAARGLVDDLLAGRFFSIDVRGNVTGWNPRAQAAFGWSTAEVSGASLFDRLVVDGLGFSPAELDDFFTAAQNGAGRRVRVLVHHQAGSQLPVELSIVPIQLSKAYELNAFLQDVSTSTASGVANEVGRVRNEHAEVLDMIVASLENDQGGGEATRLAGALIVYHMDAGAMTVAPGSSGSTPGLEHPSLPPLGPSPVDAGEARADAERVRAEIDEAVAAADEARAEAEAARAERDALQAVVDAAAADAPQLDQANASAEEARREAQEARRDAEGARAEADRERTAAQEAIRDAERLRGELEGLRSAADGSQASAESTATQLGEARAELSQAVAEGRRLGEQLERAEAELAGLRTERDTLRAEVAGLRDQLEAAARGAEAAAGETRERVAALEAELETAREDATQTGDELAAAKAELEQARKHAEDLRESVTAAEQRAEAAQAEVVTALAQAETARSEAEAARAEAAAAQARAEQAESALPEEDGADDLPDAIFEAAAIGMAFKRDGRLTRVNRAFCELTGRDRDDLLAMNPLDLVHPDERDANAATDASVAAGEASAAHAEARLIHATGVEVEVRKTTSALPDGTLLMQFELVEGEPHTPPALDDHDPLTGLFNRRRFEEELSRHVAGAARHGDGGAALMLGLGSSYEQLDQAQGDQLLKTVADALRSNLEEAEMLARLGGDEFAVLLPHADAARARKIAAHIVEAVGPQVVTIGGQSVRLTVDVGVALFDEREEPSPATAEPSDPVTVPDPDEPAPAGSNLPATLPLPGAALGPVSARGIQTPDGDLVDRIRAALAEDSFHLFAQPIIDLRTSEITQYELLIRMRDDSGRMLLPDKFLPTAQRAGLMPAIDQWVVRHAIALIQQAADDGRRLLLEVNISGDSIDDEALTTLIEAELDATGIDPHLLVIEVTESAALAKIAETIKLAKWLRSMGCRFALDDFGSTFATVKYLKDMPVDYFKLDGDLIVTLPESRTNQLLLNALMDVARGTGTQTIAVYVPDDETLVMLRQFGIGYGQGNRVGRPRPVADI